MATEREQKTHELVWEDPPEEKLRKRLKEIYPEEAEPQPEPEKPEWASVTATADRSSRDPRSDDMIRRVLTNASSPSSTAANRATFGTPVFYAATSDPVYKINTNHSDPDSKAQEARAGVRCPPNAHENEGSDGVFWIVDPDAGEINQFQRCRPYGGVDHTRKVINSWKSYAIDLETGFPVNPTGAPTCVPPVSPEDLKAGLVDHPMSMGVDDLDPGPQSPFEDSTTQGHSGGDGDLHMGNCVFLEQSEVDRMEDAGAPEWQLAVLRGLAKHGMVVGMNAGSDWLIKFESSLTADWAGSGLPSTLNYSNGVDWHKLYVVEPFPRP